MSATSIAPVPTLRIGAEVRPRTEGYTQQRGIVTEQVSAHLWAVLLYGDSTPTDFAAEELTVLA